MSDQQYQPGAAPVEKIYYEDTSHYKRERERRAEERKNAPQQCPHCSTPINQHLSEWDRIRYHCGADKCRKAASRANQAERKRQERTATRARILQWCETWLDAEQRRAVMEMCDLLMSYDYQNGHKIALQVTKVIDDRRCKHDRIAQLEQNAALWQRRAQASERQLKERIAELEAELEIFTTLHNTIHGIATDQLRKQPDPQERQPSAQEPEDEDRRAVLATLAQAGIKPYTGQEEDDTENYEGDEYEDDPEE